MSAETQFLPVLGEIPSIKLAVCKEIRSGVVIGSPFLKKWAKKLPEPKWRCA
jgi:hypothetical protein